jgi:hypothetical protein
VAPGQLWATGGVLAESCYARQQKIGSFIGTTFVARDIMQIVDALDQGDKLNYYGM